MKYLKCLKYLSVSLVVVLMMAYIPKMEWKMVLSGRADENGAGELCDFSLFISNTFSPFLSPLAFTFNQEKLLRKLLKNKNKKKQSYIVVMACSERNSEHPIYPHIVLNKIIFFPTGRLANQL